MAAIPIALGGISALGSIFGGIFGGNAAKKAAEIQAQAAREAGERALKTATDSGNTILDASGRAVNSLWDATNGANDLLGNLYNGRMDALSPYSRVGASGANALNDAITSGDLTRSFTADDMAAYDPGYQFRKDEGQRALDASAAARGGAMGGAAAKAALRYGQDYSSNEYDKAFNRFLAGQKQKYDVLRGTTDVGMKANDQALQVTNALAVPIAQNGINAGKYQGDVTMRSAEDYGNLQMEGAKIYGDATTGAANARASGIVGQANALTSGIRGAADNALSAYALYKYRPR